jgi:hypothetical protein
MLSTTVAHLNEELSLLVLFYYDLGSKYIYCLTII